MLTSDSDPQAEMSQLYDFDLQLDGMSFHNKNANFPPGIYRLVCRVSDDQVGPLNQYLFNYAQ